MNNQQKIQKIKQIKADFEDKRQAIESQMKNKLQKLRSSVEQNRIASLRDELHNL